MSVAECYVINVQCDSKRHGSYVAREQFTGTSKREAMANLRHCGWKLGPKFTAYCPECQVPAHGVRGTSEGVKR